MAVKKVWTEDDIKDMERYAGIGATLPQIARLLGVCVETIQGHARENDRVKEALERGRARASADIMGKAYEMAVSGEHPVMTIFWLKVRCRWTDKVYVAEDKEMADKIKSMPTSDLIKLVKDKVG